MRVLHVTGDLDFRAGGPIRFIYDCATECARRGWKVDVVGLRGATAFDITGVKTISFVGHWGGALRVNNRFVCWLLRHCVDYDAVVIHGLWQASCAVAGWACMLGKVPYVIVPHGMLEPWPVRSQGWRKRVLKTLAWYLYQESTFRRASYIIFTTARERERADSVFRPLSHDRRRVIPYSVRVDDLMVARQAGERLDQAVFFGRVHPKKNVELLFKAWSSVGGVKGWKLIIAGPVEDSYKDALKTLASTLRIDDSVIFTGMLDAEGRNQLLLKSKWFLLPSFQDNFGIAALEAACLGCALALSSEVYFGDMLTSPRVILNLEINEWSRFFSQTMVDDGFRTRAVLAADQSIRTYCEFNSLIEEWMAILDSVVPKANDIEV